jgi:hypothetical protein
MSVRPGSKRNLAFLEQHLGVRRAEHIFYTSFEGYFGV